MKTLRLDVPLTVMWVCLTAGTTLAMVLLDNFSQERLASTSLHYGVALFVVYLNRNKEQP